jgi:pectate lyase
MKKLIISTLIALLTITSYAQSVLINFNFQSSTLPAGVTHNGTTSLTKAADGVCTQGMVQLNGGVSPVQFMQVDVSSCTVFTFNAKSTSSTARLTTIKYKKQSDAAYTTLTTTLSISTAATFNLTTLFPVLVSVEPINVRIEAGGNIQIHDLYVTDNPSVNPAAEITAFSLPTQTGGAVINSAAGTITVNVPLGTTLTSVVPTTLSISTNATINPAATTARDFTSPVTYIVTAQSGATKTWTVTVNIIASSEKEITAFQLTPSQIGSSVINSAAGSITISMPAGASLTALVPSMLNISPLSTVSPDPSVTRDFSSPVTYTVTAQDNSTKVWTINVIFVSTFTLSYNIIGFGQVTLSPAGGSYTVGTVVTLTATPLLGGSFINWTGDASGSSTITTVTMTGPKSVTANFTANTSINFNKVVGYAGMAGDGFAGPTNGGQCATQPVLVINGPSEFNKLCESLYYRQRAFANATPNGGMLKAPLVILIKAGTYDASQALTTIGGNAYGNSMLDIASQGDLTFLGEGGVTFNFGINVKRSYNIIIRNISFHSYGDDGVNVGYPETHHIWIDHCTFGHPTTYPSSADVPDGTAEVKGGSSFVTISWCKFQNHHKTCLLGHSDNNGAEDRGRLKTTYFANYFYATNSRHPRTRFGTVHVLNNMYEDVGRGREGGFGYGIGASNESQVWAEGNFFLDTRWPMSADRSTTDFAAVYGPLLSQNSNIACFGLKSLNNEYDDSGLTQTIVGQVSPAMLNPSGMSVKFDELTSANFTYVPSDDYNYSTDLLPASAVRVLIPQNAGADKMAWPTSCSILSLDLVDFSATKTAHESTVLVSWKSLNEQNASHFEVERSTDAQNFVKIKTVKARNQKSLSQYSITDESVDNVQYYRLKMFDLDGTSTYSKTVSVSQTKGVVRTLKITPSVSSDFVNIETLTNDAATLRIVDIFGRMILTKNIEASESLFSTNYSVASLPNGIYSVVLENKNGRTVGKFVKQ